MVRHKGKFLVRRVLGLREGKMTRKKERGGDGEFVERNKVSMFFSLFSKERRKFSFVNHGLHAPTTMSSQVIIIYTLAIK